MVNNNQSGQVMIEGAVVILAVFTTLFLLFTFLTDITQLMLSEDEVVHVLQTGETDQSLSFGPDPWETSRSDEERKFTVNLLLEEVSSAFGSIHERLWGGIKKEEEFVR
ncbi:MAG TPA: hypothetical protein VJL87_01665 [Bdellovibrionota bacterium]|nr:hypothetical protein [Bdellovibrionota bacterium]